MDSKLSDTEWNDSNQDMFLDDQGSRGVDVFITGVDEQLGGF